MNNLKQAQLNHDNHLPPDTTEQDELIQSLAEELIEYGVVYYLDDMGSCTHLDELNTWTDQPSYKSKSILDKINQFKELQLDLCKSMIIDILNKGEIK